MSSTLEHDPRVIAESSGLRGVLAEYRRRLGSGDIGQLPVMVSLVVIAVIFQVLSDGRFLTPFNVVNLTLQMAAGGTISIGLVLISHNLANVYEVADRITVLRLGRYVGTYDAKATSREQLIAFMTGAAGSGELPAVSEGAIGHRETPA